MFINNYQHNIDANGRFVIPAPFREELGETFCAIKGKAGVVVLYSQDEFKRRAAALKGSSREAMQILYEFMSSAEMMTQDKQGRAVLPKSMRDYAGIESAMRITGMIDQIYICSDTCAEEPVEPVMEHTPEQLHLLAERAAELAEKEAQKRAVE